MKEKPQVFYDSSGKRKHLSRFTLTLLLLVGATFLVLFTASILIIPDLPRIETSNFVSQLGNLNKVTNIFSRNKLDQNLAVNFSDGGSSNDQKTSSENSANSSINPLPSGQKAVMSFYSPWQQTGLFSLRNNVDKLTHLMPEWLHLNSDGNGLDMYDWDTTDNPQNPEVVQIARDHNVRIEPILNNVDGEQFDPKRVHQLLNSPENEKSLVIFIQNWLVTQGFQGINVDLENLDPNDYKKLPEFLGMLTQALHAKGMEVSVDVEAENDNLPAKEINDLADYVIIMSYDENAADTNSGPIASMDWYNKIVNDSLQKYSREKLIVGIGNYGYDWKKGSKNADSLTYQSALLLFDNNSEDPSTGKSINFDSKNLNPYFAYKDQDGVKHKVWFLDGVTAYNQWSLANKLGTRGGALWVMGSEDPSLWLFFDKNKAPNFDAQNLSKIDFPYEVEFQGDGEILNVDEVSHEGSRDISFDSQNNLITNENYTTIPSPYIIKRTGFKDKTVVLTFDDGPSDYTNRILDELNQYNVPATFFVIGTNAESHQDIIRREWNDGYEIGNHTYSHPNIGAIGETRGTLEINATQRIIQSITGHSTTLFRPPYNADAEPVSGEEVLPIIYATKLGYVSVGEYIDPQDWNIDEGSVRTAEDIAQDVISQVHEGRGNVILLHDGGGNRDLTVAALPLVISQLKEEGYTFANVSDLINLPRDSVMPPVQNQEQVFQRADKSVFFSLDIIKKSVAWLFIIGIFLGVSRVIFIIFLSLVSRKREAVRKFDTDYHPKVSAIIAAYNEEMVISKTIASLLKSSYQPTEIIVVDDGSTDKTAERINQEFGKNPRVKLISQENAGKGTALNKAIAYAKGEILLCLDADTQILPSAIGLIVRHFEDQKVGAVAGNVKVGNKINILTKWQSIEYITSQNLDRQAYGLLNTITVIPGAFGAWRKTAVLESGGYLNDTLAEDMDLTWRLIKNGWVLANEIEAVALTEAPHDLKSLYKQRFRWGYGTLQCLWKHRGVLFHYGWFGWLGIPSLWIFQVGFELIAPFIDLQLIFHLILVGFSFANWALKKETLDVLRMDLVSFGKNILFFYCLFFVFESLSAYIAFKLQKAKTKFLWLLFWQRFVYRQLIYVVMVRAVWTAIKGVAQGWSKLERKGTVAITRE